MFGIVSDCFDPRGFREPRLQTDMDLLQEKEVSIHEALASPDFSADWLHLSQLPHTTLLLIKSLLLDRTNWILHTACKYVIFSIPLFDNLAQTQHL